MRVIILPTLLVLPESDKNSSGQGQQRPITVGRPDRRFRGGRATCAHAGYEILECLGAPGGKTRHAFLARSGAIRGEPRHNVGLTPGCQRASGNNARARGDKRRPALYPMSEEYSRRCSVSRLRHDAKNEMRPRLARRHRKLKGLADTSKHVALGDTAGVTLVDCSSQRC